MIEETCYICRSKAVLHDAQAGRRARKVYKCADEHLTIVYYSGVSKNDSAMKEGGDRTSALQEFNMFLKELGV